MQVRVYYPEHEGGRTELPILRAFYEGCPEEKEWCPLSEYEPSDIAVVFGVYKKNIPVSFPRGRVIAKQQLRNLDTVIIETGYVNRGSSGENHYAVGLNGLNGRADFNNKGMPADRAGLLPPLKNWRTEGDHVLLCGQVPWDASVDHTNHVQWLIETAAVLQMMTKREIVFRPHPLAKLPNIRDCTYSFGRPLSEDLDGCHVCVTFNSNSGVDSVINGVPVYAFDIGSMVYPVCNKLWTDLESPKMPDRTQWYNDLAYSQWQPQEMAEGSTWSHLMRSKK